MTQTRISEIIKWRTRSTAYTALRLSYYYGTSVKFWLGLQDNYDLEAEVEVKNSKLECIKKYEKDAA
ncbi:MAG: transcriptional regulator [Cyclobacteriaceae bacterium]